MAIEQLKQCPSCGCDCGRERTGHCNYGQPSTSESDEPAERKGDCLLCGYCAATGQKVQKPQAAVAAANAAPEEKTYSFGQTAFERMRMTLERIAVKNIDMTPENEAKAVLKEIGYWNGAANAAEAKPEPTEQDAHQMGARGSMHNAAEQKLFEAYMKGHCWAVGPWVTSETGGHYYEQLTRMLWAVWRDRAALGISAALPVPMDAQPVKAKDCNIETFSQSDVGSYVRHLTWYVWNTHYREKSPNFELLPDTVGVLTQLDNMLTGWKAAQPVSGVVDEFEKWKASLPCDDAEHHFLEWLIHNGMDSQDDVARFAWQARAALSSNQVNAAQPENAVIHRAVEYVTRPPHGRKYPAICDVVPADEVMAFAVDLVRHIGGVK